MNRDNIRRATKQTSRRVQWHDAFSAPWQYNRVEGVPNAVTSRLPGESQRRYKERRREVALIRKFLMSRYRAFAPKILRARKGTNGSVRLVNMGPGTFRKADYEE